jgi:hypothetical protein
MSNRLFLILVALLAATCIGIGSFAVTNDTKLSQSTRLPEKKNSPQNEALLHSKNNSELSGEIVEWANRHFSNDSEVFGDFSSRSLGPDQEVSNDIAIPHPPFTLEQIIEFEVLAIPNQRRSPEMNNMQMPTYHALALLRDSEGDVYNVVIKSFKDEKDSFIVESVGPLVDNTPERISLPINQRRLRGLPFLGSYMFGARGKPVLVPYPHPMNQIFYMYGGNPETAVFRSMHTGRLYHGLNNILDTVDEDIRHFRDE